MPRRDQNLAVLAWTLVDGVPEPVRREFRSRAMTLGPMLVGSGLAATAAFHEAKAGPVPPTDATKHAYRIVADSLAQHVLQDPETAGDQLVVEVGSMATDRYRQASADARLFALWVRRAAEAIIPPANQQAQDAP